MLRIYVIIATIVLAVPSLAVAQLGVDPHHVRPGVGRGGPHGPGPGFGRPRMGGPGGQFGFHGHMYGRVHLAPFAYPHGWRYRRWVVGAALPALFLVPAYYYPHWAALGLPPPEPGYQWVRYGPDLLLVNVGTGQVVDTAYGVFY